MVLFLAYRLYKEKRPTYLPGFLLEGQPHTWWVLVKFSSQQDGRLFEVGANLILGA